MTKPRLVVVDKSAIIINWVKAALGDDYVVTGATSAMDATGAVVRDEPVLVLIDPAMPIVGEEVVQLVRDALGKRPALLVLFSSLPEVELAEKAQELEAHAYIEKSGDAHTFANRIRAFNLPSDVWSAGALPQIPPQPAPRAPAEPAAKTLLVAGRHWLSHGTLLPRAGFSINAVGDAGAVHEALRVDKPALLVVGPDLPDATVPALCRAVRSEPSQRNVSILFVGEPGDQVRAQRAREAGANETLLRPLDEMTLFQAVGALTDVAARRKARLLVRIDLEMEHGGEFCVGFTHNVSASGMLLETDHQLEVGQQLTVRFFVPGSPDEVESLVDVVRLQARPDDLGIVAGVRFVRIDERQSGAIDRFVRAQTG